ncbi:hypothetical protein LASUN_04320 [Lentilactobacillus sunkii]|uniref:N-acetyltransferase domain-containing protein n=1 Tax=Lentilactobacillus sunkii TaxID=481719 RepID=A0A1E7XHX3_9LACO|nr:GNAT family N-acetyltransferase [Lentilactobacillus sunkii]OFA12715.1 hypothetical protein LASUN_04320 [Lentilactobacillus sunkii]
MIEKCSISGLIDEEYLKKFDCGENSVNEFLTGCSKKYASEDLRETTLFYETECKKIIGYYSVVSSIVEVKTEYDVKQFRDKDTMPEDHPLNAVFPAIEISWFGVSKEWQRKHIGAGMMLQLFKDLVNVRYLCGVGFTVVVVDSLPGAIEFYERYGFKYLHQDYDNPNGMQMPKDYPMFLDFEKMVKIYERAAKSN